jgi:hypothetical protein
LHDHRKPTTIVTMMGAHALGRARIAGATLTMVALALALASAGSAVSQTTASGPISVTNVRLSAVWKEGWLTGSIRFSIVVTGPASVSASVRPVVPGPLSAHDDYSLTKSGSFTETIKLPPRLLPRQYVLKLTGTSGAKALPEADTHFTVPAPPEGVVDLATISAGKNGKATHVLASPHELWVRFHFLVPPTAKTVKVVWRTPSYTFVGAVTKPYATTIDSFISSGSPLPQGTWYAILMVNGKTAKRQDVRVT